MPHTRLLDEIEQRVIGALMEKQQTTPDYYPMTVNALIGACNQKSNRDPVTKLSETQVRDALSRLKKDMLAWNSEGARAERWEQRISSRWFLDSRSKAVMTLLLLRGPQTPGELRNRSGRLKEFESPAEVESVLAEMAEGDNPLVRQLPREPGKRERRWCHVMGVEPVVDPAQPDHGAVAVVTAPAVDSQGAITTSAPVAEPPSDSRLGALEQRVADLEERLARLEKLWV